MAWLLEQFCAVLCNTTTHSHFTVLVLLVCFCFILGSVYLPCVLCILLLLSFNCQYKHNWLPGKTRLQNDLLCVDTVSLDVFTTVWTDNSLYCQVGLAWSRSGTWFSKNLMTNLQKTYEKVWLTKNLGWACDYKKILQKNLQWSYAKLTKNLQWHHRYLTKT